MALAGQQQPLASLPFASLLPLALIRCRAPSLQILSVSNACCCTLQVPLSQEELEGQAKVDKLALGVAGGFNPDAAKHRVEERYFLAVVPNQLRIPLPCPDLPELVLNAVEAVQVCTVH